MEKEKLLILEWPDRNFGYTYRGINRGSPLYFGTYEKDISIDNLLNWYFFEEIEENFLPDYHNDLTKARLFLSQYYKIRAELDPDSSQHEIIEFTRDEEKPVVGNTFFGFDLTCCRYSLMLLYFDNRRDENSEPKIDFEKSKNHDILIELINLFFLNKLNKFFLFDHYSDALFCLKCLEIFLDMAPPGSMEKFSLSPDAKDEHHILGIWGIEPPSPPLNS